MKKFEVETKRTDKYQITIDEKIWTPDAIFNWSQIFWPVFDIEDLARSLSEALIRSEPTEFIEGFGYLLVFNRKGTPINQFKNGELVKYQDKCQGVSVRVISREDYETSSEEK